MKRSLLGTDVALVSGETAEIMGTMKVSESYKIDKQLECKSIFTTNDAEHPGVKMVMEQKEWNIAGPVKGSLGELLSRRSSKAPINGRRRVGRSSRRRAGKP